MSVSEDGSIECLQIKGFIIRDKNGECKPRKDPNHSLGRREVLIVESVGTITGMAYELFQRDRRSSGRGEPMLGWTYTR